MTRIFVASFGYKRVIRHVLDHHGLARYVKEVITPAALLKPEGTTMKDKNELIAYGAKKHDVARALLVDHWTHHIDAARKAGYLAYQVNPHTGMTVRDFDSLLRQVKEERVDGVFLAIDDVVCEGHVTPQFIADILRDGKLVEPPEVHLSPGAALCARAIHRL